VYRLAQALDAHGMLERDGSRFRLGVTLLHLGARVAEGFDLRRQVMPHLQWLKANTDENAELHIRRGEARVVIEMVRSSQNLRPIVELGASLPLHLGAAGKVLLAWLPAEQRDSLVAASVARFGEGRPFDADALRDRLRRVKEEGWTASEGERSPGVASIAAPVFEADGTVAGAVALSAPAARLQAERCRALAPLVCEAAARASRQLGYAGETPSQVLEPA
jgi:IclR family acetate operon transcriptional repressor